MAAANAVFQSLIPGDHVVVAKVLYWGVRKWLAEFGLTWGLDVDLVHDMTGPGGGGSRVRPGATRLVWVETPANPTWEVTDLAAVCRLAHAAGARVAVDNTVATPVLMRPLALGADLVVHSATEYLNGHSDALVGAVVSARDDPFWQRVRSWRRMAGRRARRVRRVAPAARHAHLVPARAPQFGHCAGHRPALRGPSGGLHKVLYPGLPSHPGHEIAARQMSGGFGGMLSIRLAGGACAGDGRPERAVKLFVRDALPGRRGKPDASTA